MLHLFGRKCVGKRQCDIIFIKSHTHNYQAFCGRVTGIDSSHGADLSHGGRVIGLDSNHRDRLESVSSRSFRNSAKLPNS